MSVDGTLPNLEYLGLKYKNKTLHAGTGTPNMSECWDIGQFAGRAGQHLSYFVECSIFIPTAVS